MLSGHDHHLTTDELSLHKTGVAGNQKTKLDLSMFNSFTGLLFSKFNSFAVVICPCFQGLPI